MRLFKAILLIAALFALGMPGALAAEPAKLVGMVKTPLTLDAATLGALPVKTLDVSFATATGSEKASYTGVLLWDVVNRAGLINGKGRNARLRHTLLITSSDGYAIALALGEFDPGYGNRQVLLAYKSDKGGVSYDALRLLVPGDVHSGRSVRGIASIEVK